MKRISSCWAALAVVFWTTAIAYGDWTLNDGPHPEQSGRKVDIKHQDRLVARFIYGEGQIKPYLHVYGDEQELLTEWSPEQQFSHHRGIFIGWNKIKSDLGDFDLWHLSNGGRMTVTKLEKLVGTANSATLEATIEWSGGAKDAQGSDLLIKETRTFVISRPENKRTQVDVTFALQAVRPLHLGGDLQHAGIHFRGSKELLNREGDTSYLWEPEVAGPGGKVVSKDLKWCRLLFPVGNRWYSATQLNAPSNPVEELSWRNYGRFGFFFQRSLKSKETLTLQYRFLTARVEAPEHPGKPSQQQKQKARAEAQAAYEAFLKELPCCD